MAETEPTVFAAWNRVMRDVTGVPKDGYNEQQKFKFRGVDAVVNAIGPALREHNVVVVPTIEHVEPGTILIGREGTTCMQHVRVVTRFTVYGPAGDSFVGTAAAEAMDSGDKATSKAMSVAFRTFLLQAACLPTGDPDPDSPVRPSQQQRQQQRPQHPPAAREQAKPAPAPQTNGTGAKRDAVKFGKPTQSKWDGGDPCPHCHCPSQKMHLENCRYIDKTPADAMRDMAMRHWIVETDKHGVTDQDARRKLLRNVLAWKAGVRVDPKVDPPSHTTYSESDLALATRSLDEYMAARAARVAPNAKTDFAE
jgi:hypothetical protein